MWNTYIELGCRQRCCSTHGYRLLQLHVMDDNSNSEPEVPNDPIPSLEWAKDDSWKTPFVDYGGSERFKAIETQLGHKGLLALAEGERYMFIDVLNYWCNLAARVSMIRLCGLMEIKNVTVNYPEATVGFNDFITNWCDSNEATQIPVSVCIGTSRLEVTIIPEKKTLVFTDSRTVIERKPHFGKIPDAVYRMCIMPVRSTIYPVRYVYPGKCTLLGYLAQVLPDTRDLVTILWHVGNSVVDPVSNPKSLMLYGPGGSGKSTVLRVINNSLGSCCGLLPSGCLTSKSEVMPITVSSVIASNRMAVCYDVALDEQPLNMTIFKNISGSDYVRVGDHSVKTNCSLAIATNGHPDIKKQPEYNSDAIMRRIVGLHMEVSALDIPNTGEPMRQDDKIDFVCASIYTRMMYEYIPVSPTVVLSTLTSSRYIEARSMIEETTGSVHVDDSVEVLCIIGCLIKVPPERVAYKARLISRSAVCEFGGRLLIRGLCPKRSPHPEQR